MDNLNWVDMILSQSMEGVMWVVDESIAIKNPSAKQTQYLTKLGKDRKVKFKHILTGAQVSNSNADVFAQYRFLDPQIIGYGTYTSFKAQYCVTKVAEGTHNEFIIGYKNAEELVAKIDPFSYRVRKEECLTLPPKVYIRRPFDLHPEESRLYKQLKAEYIAQMNDDTVTAELALVRLMRLQQMSSGWFPGDECFDMICLKPSRLLALLYILKENKGKKAIIWSHFVDDIKLITQTLNSIKPGCALPYYGEISGPQRKESRDKFQNDLRSQFLVAQFQTASRGLTLTAAEYVVYYANQHGLDMRLQSEDRCHRIDEQRMAGRDGIVYYDLCANGTGDAKLIAGLRKKKDIADIINNDPKSGFLAYI